MEIYHMVDALVFLFLQCLYRDVHVADTGIFRTWFHHSFSSLSYKVLSLSPPRQSGVHHACLLPVSSILCNVGNHATAEIFSCHF